MQKQQLKLPKNNDDDSIEMIKERESCTSDEQSKQ